MERHPDKPEDMWREWQFDHTLYRGIAGEEEMDVSRKIHEKMKKHRVLISADTLGEAHMRTYRGGKK